MAARGYTVLILPLGSALGSWDALRGFLRLRRLQGLERERDALLQGLELAERLRAWCQRHLQAAQRRRRHAQRAGADYLGDSGSDHSCLLLAKIQEGSTPPCSHQDQARDPPVPLWKRLEFQQQTLSVLREQNRLLIKVRRLQGAEDTKAADQVAAVGPSMANSIVELGPGWPTGPLWPTQDGCQAPWPAGPGWPTAANCVVPPWALCAGRGLCSQWPNLEAAAAGGPLTWPIPHGRAA
ncbi:suppressor APC domain-containing protein 1 isoform X7 [Alligator mississippiensis]|uniref:suppressor APC domain-containing protein 1 isoform X7 n=1 Tax=Alligator mississippiensis TaxID=8496 RepID=UPI0009073E00|nr:suppressor APC domain-containing protein 1 isoform X7 [Alligator mississippiensis]